jgi:hypothetical protein
MNRQYIVAGKTLSCLGEVHTNICRSHALRQPTADTHYRNPDQHIPNSPSLFDPASPHSPAWTPPQLLLLLLLLLLTLICVALSVSCSSSAPASACSWSRCSVSSAFTCDRADVKMPRTSARTQQQHRQAGAGTPTVSTHVALMS